jgi:hypothetical protein
VESWIGITAESRPLEMNESRACRRCVWSLFRGTARNGLVILTGCTIVSAGCAIESYAGNKRAKPATSESSSRV